MASMWVIRRGIAACLAMAIIAGAVAAQNNAPTTNQAPGLKDPAKKDSRCAQD